MKQSFNVFRLMWYRSVNIQALTVNFCFTPITSPPPGRYVLPHRHCPIHISHLHMSIIRSVAHKALNFMYLWITPLVWKFVDLTFTHLTLAHKSKNRWLLQTWNVHTIRTTLCRWLPNLSLPHNTESLTRHSEPSSSTVSFDISLVTQAICQDICEWNKYDFCRSFTVMT